MQSNIIEITRDMIPSGLYDIGFRMPTYEDLRRARKKYPTPRFEGDARAPYSLEELLFAMCLATVNGQEFPQNLDMKERLAEFPIEDRQFLMAVFVELVFITPEQAQEARDFANRMRLNARSLFTTIPKEIMPSGQHTVTLRAPNTNVQMEVNTLYESSRTTIGTGATIDEYFVAYCLKSIDGKEVDPTKVKDFPALLGDLPIADVGFASTVFVNLYTLDDQGMGNAKKLAQTLRGKISTEPATSTPAPVEKKRSAISA